ncbi:MAG: hypothetical protein ACLU9S_24595 [Oscillospiraceae bacterium]
MTARSAGSPAAPWFPTTGAEARPADRSYWTRSGQSGPSACATSTATSWEDDQVEVDIRGKRLKAVIPPITCRWIPHPLPAHSLRLDDPSASTSVQRLGPAGRADLLRRGLKTHCGGRSSAST